MATGFGQSIPTYNGGWDRDKTTTTTTTKTSRIKIFVSGRKKERNLKRSRQKRKGRKTKIISNNPKLSASNERSIKAIEFPMCHPAIYLSVGHQCRLCRIVSRPFPFNGSRMTPRTRGGVQFAGNDGKYICIYQRVLNYTPLYQRLLYYTYIQRGHSTPLGYINLCTTARENLP